MGARINSWGRLQIQRKGVWKDMECRWGQPSICYLGDNQQEYSPQYCSDLCPLFNETYTTVELACSPIGLSHKIKEDLRDGEA